MNILQYLIELLKIRKEIGIEGLGTLYKKKTPGRYDAESHSFVPPSHVLEFTNDVKEHFNLTQYIQSKRGISEESAKYFINGFVEEVKKELGEAGIYDLENLGQFIFENAQLSFRPTHLINIGFDFFALPPVTAELTPPNTKEDSHIESSKKPKVEVEEVAIDSPEQGEEIENLAADEIEDEGVPNATTNEEIEEIPLVEELDEATNEVHLTEEETEFGHEDSENSDNEELPLATTNEETPLVGEEVVAENLFSIEESATEIANAADTIKPFEESEATQDEVYEEIAEVSTLKPTDIEVNENTVEDTETWDFNDEDVISQEDIQEEKFPSDDDDDEDNQDAKNHDIKPDQGIKIKATTQNWDFENAVDTDNGLPHNETGEFYDIDEPEPLEEDAKGMSLYKKLTIGILAAGVIIAAVYLYNPDLINGLYRDDAISTDQKMAIPLPQKNLKTQQDSLSFADSIMENAEKAGLAVEPAKDTLKVTANAKPVNTTTYEIISVALSTNTEVNQYIASMKKNGFDAKIANMPGKIYKKISIASYTNRDSATKDLKKLRVQLKNSGLYIFEDKNK